MGRSAKPLRGGVKGDGTGAEGAVCTKRGGRAVVKAKSLGWS